MKKFKKDQEDAKAEAEEGEHPEKTTRQAHARNKSSVDFDRLDPSPIMTRIFKKIKTEMSTENVMKKGRLNVMNKEPEIGKLKLKEGSLNEYIMGYNNLFNKGKRKVFPLQSLEEIVSDPSKFNHNKKVIAEMIQREKESFPGTKDVLGSKYRF